MEFDINLILVPITLIFLVVFLVDILWLKQHTRTKQNTKRLNASSDSLKAKENALAQGLKKHGISVLPEYFVVDISTPQELVVLHDQYYDAKRHYAQIKSQNLDIKEHFLVRWAYEYLPVLVFLVVVRAFVAEPFNIPSSSMVPSLHTGDFIIVDKSAYGLRLPITHTKILDTKQPKNGDVVVFRYPKNPKRYYIKRLIGVPGDVVGFSDGKLSINGQIVDTQKADVSLSENLTAKLYPSVINGQKLSQDEQINLGREEESYTHYYREKLGEHTYNVRYLADLNSSQYAPFVQAQSGQLLQQSKGRAWQITVPEGQYFVMGDNRDRSEDSRFWGFVPEANLAGRATYIWMHKDEGLHLPSFGRVGKID